VLKVTLQVTTPGRRLQSMTALFNDVTPNPAVNRAESLTYDERFLFKF